VAADAQGNTSALYDMADASLAASYERGPFGEPLRVSGKFGEANPIRWSTKYLDWETGWAYYGFRFYCPVTGRWASRDPIGEAGGVNLQGFCGNNPVNLVDPLGLLPPDAIPINGSAPNPFSPLSIPIVTSVISDSQLGGPQQHEEGVTVFKKDEKYYYKRGTPCPNGHEVIMDRDDPDAVWSLHVHPTTSPGPNPWSDYQWSKTEIPWMVNAWDIYRMTPLGVPPFRISRTTSQAWPEAYGANGVPLSQVADPTGYKTRR
jgi:RHS repeat-associated protein